MLPTLPCNVGSCKINGSEVEKALVECSAYGIGREPVRGVRLKRNAGPCKPKTRAIRDAIGETPDSSRVLQKPVPLHQRQGTTTSHSWAAVQILITFYASSSSSSPPSRPPVPSARAAKTI